MEIEVLLATHNGSRYLHSFLDSLVAQKDVEIHLKVSDDNSEDETLSIIYSYGGRFRSLTVFSGPDTGAKDNFAHLIHQSDSDFSAFADQDDIWFPNHLIDSIDCLRQDEKIPALTFSKQIEFSEGEILGEWPPIRVNPSLPRLLTENYARGCSQVLNRKLMELLKKTDFDEIYMHDWWAILVAKTCGTVHYLNRPTMAYRIHARNTIGRRKSPLYRFQVFWRNYFNGGSWIPSRQAKLLHNTFGHLMSKQDKLLINKFANLDQIPFQERFNLLIKSKLSLRHSRLENFLLKLLLLFYPRKKRAT